MTLLETWMEANGVGDDAVATETGVSRVQISRIRRGLSKPSPELALKLSSMTGIAAWDFVKPDEAAAA